MKHSFKTLMHRLSRAGLKRDFVRLAILPEWWDVTCAEEPGLLPELDIRVARFLGIPVSAVRNPEVPLSPPTYAGVQLRRVRDIEQDRLAPTIHSALRIGEAVVRSLAPPGNDPVIPPANGLEWRKQLCPEEQPISLEDIVENLWKRGIPVVPLDVLPSPSFQGIACVVEGRPVILLGHKYDEPGHVAYFIAHETGHIVNRDCALDQPVVDEDEKVLDTDEAENKADIYATRVLIGDDNIPPIDSGDFKDLARHAAELERKTGADASIIIFAWAAQSGDYAMATMAVNALYRGFGARRTLRKWFDQHVDLDNATESDRALLRCVYGDPERDEIAH